MKTAKENVAVLNFMVGHRGEVTGQADLFQYLPARDIVKYQPDIP